MRWSAQQVRRSALLRIAPALGVAVLCLAAAPREAAAQFAWFGQPGASAQDAYDTISEHGLRLAGPMMQNRDVYIADVIDRRQRRERVIISRESGQIVQRFLVDTGRPAPNAALPGSPNGGALPPRQRTDGDVFARIVRGFNDDSAPRPPADISQPDRQDAVEPRTLPRQQRLSRPRSNDVEPHLATRRDDAPVTSRPLAPVPTAVVPTAPAGPVPTPAPAAAQPAPAAPPAVAAKPPVQPAAPAAPQAAPAAPRATVVTTDPLRIPGTKEPEAPKSTVAAAPAKPVPPAAPKAPTDVPVAPLD